MAPKKLDYSAALKEDPALAFNFGLEIRGIVEAYFLECSGLQSEREVVEYKAGGENSYIHKFPGQVKYSNLVLKRGMTTSDELWKWYKAGLEKGDVDRKAVSLLLFDVEGEQLKRWEFADAFPIKWIGPTLKTSDNGVAVETLELAHHGFKLS